MFEGDFGVKCRIQYNFLRIQVNFIESVVVHSTLPPTLKYPPEWYRSECVLGNEQISKSMLLESSSPRNCGLSQFSDADRYEFGTVSSGRDR